MIFEKIRTYIYYEMTFLNVFYNIHCSFAKKSIEKFVSFEKYRAK